MFKNRLLYILIISEFFIFAPYVQSQTFDDGPSVSDGDKGKEDESDGADGEVEDLYDKFDVQETKKRTEKKENQRKAEQANKPKSDPSTLSELSTLAPLSDIAVIQRRFLPKTKRFEASANLLGTINNPFFINMGASVRGGYYFQERYGVELMYFFLSSSERTVTDNLRSKRNVKTESLVTPKSYFGADFKWTPIYGKTTFINKRIVPFDFYFSAGLGNTSIADGSSAPTVHLGGGQAFALSKSMALRWDLSWNLYQADVEKLKDGVLKKEKSSHDDLYISLGVSFFFPEATYR